MKIPEYISVKEVKRVCSELKIRDWTQLKKAEVLIEKAELILAEMKLETQKSDLIFQHGLEVELEHGIGFPEANVTNKHPILTGKNSYDTL